MSIVGGKFALQVYLRNFGIWIPHEFRWPRFCQMSLRVGLLTNQTQEGNFKGRRKNKKQRKGRKTEERKIPSRIRYNEDKKILPPYFHHEIKRFIASRFWRIGFNKAIESISAYVFTILSGNLFRNKLCAINWGIASVASIEKCYQQFLINRETGLSH